MQKEIGFMKEQLQRRLLIFSEIINYKIHSNTSKMHFGRRENNITIPKHVVLKNKMLLLMVIMANYSC